MVILTLCCCTRGKIHWMKIQLSSSTGINEWIFGQVAAFCEDYRRLMVYVVYSWFMHPSSLASRICTLCKIVSKTIFFLLPPWALISKMTLESNFEANIFLYFLKNWLIVLFIGIVHMAIISGAILCWTSRKTRLLYADW